jgi:hypothetical protein
MTEQTSLGVVGSRGRDCPEMATTGREWPFLAGLVSGIINARRPRWKGFRAFYALKREWMGIEPTWQLFRCHHGFEAQGAVNASPTV